MIANNTSGPNSNATVCGCCGVDWFESHGHRQVHFDAVASIPLAMNRRKTSRSSWWLHAAVHRNRGPCGPCRNPETHRKIRCLRGLHIELHHAVKRVQAFLL